MLSRAALSLLALVILATPMLAGSVTKLINIQIEYVGVPVHPVNVLITKEDLNTHSFSYEWIMVIGNSATTATFECGGQFGVIHFDVLGRATKSDGSFTSASGIGGAQACNDNTPLNVSLLVNDLGGNIPQNLGGCDGNTAPITTGRPVNTSNGNMYLHENDYYLPGSVSPISIGRSYNSLNQVSGHFGVGWTSEFDESITPYIPGDFSVLVFRDIDGRVYYIVRDSDSMYHPASPNFHIQVVKNVDGSFNLTFKDGRVHKFDSFGKILWRADPNGNQVTFNYVSDQLTSVTDPFGRTVNVTVNTSGKITQISDSIGAINYAYDPTGTLLQSVTYSDASKYKFEYVTNGASRYISTVKDALDNVLESHSYDATGRATTSELQNGIEHYSLDYTNADSATDPYTVVTDGLGRVTKYHFSKSGARNVVTKIEGLCGCGGSGSETTSYQYDSNLNLVKRTDALGRDTTFTFDDNGNLLTRTDVLGTQIFTYNALGEVMTYRDRIDYLNNVDTVTNTYNTAGGLLTTTVRNVLADNSIRNETTTLAYTAIGQLQTIKDALNHTTTLGYDTQGRLTQVTDANNKNTTFGYDARARVTSQTNVLNETTIFGYDGRDRRNKITFPDSYFIIYTYDLAGRLTGYTDAKNNTTAYGYDPAYRLTSITDPLNHVTTFGYDVMSNLASVTDALGNTTNYLPDDFNRLTKITLPPASPGATRLEENRTYDSVGKIKTRVDTAGRTTNYDYDNANRLIKVTDAQTHATSFDYNPRSQLTKVTDALNQQYTFAYDVPGHLLSQTRAGSTMSLLYDSVGNRTQRTDYLGRVTTYEFDILNRLKKVNYIPDTQGGQDKPPISMATYNYDDLSRLTSAVNQAGTVSFTYDNRDRLKTETDVFGHVVEYGYDANSDRNLLKLDGTSYSTYAFDNVDRLTSITNTSDSSVIGFGYDNADRLTSRTYPNGVNTTYEYDGMSRLTRLKDVSAAETLFDRQYSYNTANQISQIVEPDTSRTFGYDNVDRLTSVADTLNGNESYAFDAVGNRTSSNRSNAYTYLPNNKLSATDTGTYNNDPTGNMLSKSEGSKRWTYLWDYENRLTKVWDRKSTIRYVYDALGRRVAQYGGAKGQTKFTYEGDDVLLDDSGGNLTKYVNGPGVDNKLRQTAGSTASYFLADHLGSTNGLTDASGTLTASNSYDSFGNPRNSSFPTRYQYTGREFDPVTGLQYNRARWYDSAIGRFISEDPIGFAGGDINLFSYVWNSPNTFLDPAGFNGSDAADDMELGVRLYRRLGLPDPAFAPILNFHGDGISVTGTVLSIANLLRVGTATGQAIYCDDLPDYRRLELISDDVVRAGEIFLLLAGPGAEFAEGEAAINPNAPGVYDMTPSSGRYIGQSQNMGSRIASHFRPSGKFGNQTAGGLNYYEMPGSTKLEREVYEQYRIKQAGIDNLQNIRNPMGGRVDLYDQMIDDIIDKYNLPR